MKGRGGERERRKTTNKINKERQGGINKLKSFTVPSLCRKG